MFERDFTNKEIYQECLDTDDSKMFGFIVGGNDQYRVELSEAEDKTKWLQLREWRQLGENGSKDNDLIKQMPVTSEEDVKNIMRIYTSDIRVYDWESCIPYDGNVNSIPIKDSVEEIVKDFRAIGPDYLLDICESEIFKLKPGMELDAEHQTLYTQAVEYMVDNDFFSSQILSYYSYYSLMKEGPCMLFNDFTNLKYKEMMTLRRNCWDKRIPEINTRGKDVKNITGQVRGKTVKIGLAYRSGEKVTFNSPAEFDKQYTTAEFKEKLHENNWKVGDKAPIVPQKVFLPEM